MPIIVWMLLGGAVGYYYITHRSTSAGTVSYKPVVNAFGGAGSSSVQHVYDPATASYRAVAPSLFSQQ